MSLYLGDTVIAPNISNAANKSLSNLDSTGQGVIDGKVDLDGSNATFPHITETYKNGTEWYRVWSDGWCEQGGYIEQPTATVGYITLLKPYLSVDYRIFGFEYGTGGAVLGVYEGSQTASSFGLINRTGGTAYAFYASWYTQGYIS